MSTIIFAQYWRLEPRVRPDGSGGNLRQALEARIHDPLWSVGRQWQLGELQGEDNRSPIATSVRTRSGPLTRFRGREDAPQDYRRELPLEMLVEHEPADAGDGAFNPGTVPARDRARAGLALLDLVSDIGQRERVRGALVAQFPLPILPALARRAPDGVALYQHVVVASGTIDGLPAADTTALQTAIALWRTWFDREIMDVTPDCWEPERLEYRFAVGGALDDRTLALDAPDFRGGPLDWFDLDIDATGGNLGLQPAAPGTVDSRRSATLPIRATFPGMPVNRWWELEDGRVNLARVDAGPLDLARMLLIEFTAVYGNDWFVVPVGLPFGTLSALDEVIVTNTFGERYLMPTTDAADTPWSMFRHSVAGQRPDASVLSLLPVVPTAHEGEPIEEVLFMRDEMANLAWAVVKIQQGADGRPERLSGDAPAPELPPPADAQALRYQLQSNIPRAWVPLVPVQINESLEGGAPVPTGHVRLRRGRLALAGGQAQPRTRALVLEPGRPRFDIHEEEIPRSGLRVTRVPIVTRWLGGTTLRWTARRKRTGKGEGSSNLRFDQAIEPRTPTP